MHRLRVFLSIVCVSLTAPPAFGQQADAPAGDSERTGEWIVRGLSATDLLNIREKPSPLGKTLGRLPNGSLVEMLECEAVDRYEWCRIEAIDVADLAGWAPARYLQSLAQFSAEMAAEAAGDDPAREAPAGVPVPLPAPRVEADSPPQPEPAAAPSPVETVEGPAPATDEAGTAGPVPQAPAVADVEDAGGEGTAPRTDADGTREARLADEQAVGALPSGLEARFAGAAPAPLIEPARAEPVMALLPERRAAVAEDTREATAPIEAPEPEPAQETHAALGAAPAAEAAPADAGVPVPTPRPGSPALADDAAGPTADAEQVVAAVRDPTAAATASPRGELAGEVPCARYVGQPMTRCLVLVARTGSDTADVTVVWPDGGTRLIEFRGGLPVRAGSGDEIRFTREGTLNMIRIGSAERFEILDALAFGGEASGR